MEPWILIDGTEVRQGGVISGESFSAGWLRAMFSAIRGGAQYSSGFGPSPHDAPLDLNVDYLLDAYLRRVFKADVVSGPLIVYPTSEPREPPVDGNLY